jgi:hypothetical protein
MTTTAVISDPIGSWFTQSDYTVSTEATYRLVLDEFIARHADPFSVSERDVADFVLLDAEGRRRTVSGNSLRRYRTALKADWCSHATQTLTTRRPPSHLRNTSQILIRRH